MKKKMALSILIVISMLMSLIPTWAVTAFAETTLQINSVQFRANPKSYYVFDDDVPYNMLWVEFSNRVDHAATYQKDSRTYLLDGTYYQIVVERPQHGPAESQHPAATMIPDNGIEGGVRNEFSDNDAGTKHRYHGWQLGSDSLFHQDTTNDYQIGDYTVKLMKLTPTEEEISAGGDTLKNCATKAVVSEKSLKILEVTYKLSERDKAAGYKLTADKYGTVDGDGQTAKILAMQGDWIFNSSPALDQTSATQKDKNMTIAGWKLVKSGVAEDKKIGDKIPEDTDENPNDKITLEAVLDEAKIYTYDFTLDDDSKTDSVVPTKPPAEASPSPTAPPASYNKLLSKSDDEKKIEYEPTATLEPLTLRLVNTGNQRICLNVFSQNNLFDVKKVDVNADKNDAKNTYDDGGLDSGKQFWYIPSAKDCETHAGNDWKNYAEVVITPRKGLGAGEHTGMISVMPINGPRIMTNFNLTIKVDKKTVKIKPENTTKDYGKELTQSDILCDVYDSSGVSLLDNDKTAAELGITLQSDGMSKDATVNGGPYDYRLAEVASTGNYDVTLKDGENTKITVQKATPVINSEPQITTTDNVSLSDVDLKGRYENPHSHDEVTGTFEWLEKNYTIPSGQKGTITKQYKFTPTDTDNYNVVESANANITVTSKKATNLRAYSSSLSKTYNGEEQKPNFTWDREGDVQTGYLDVKYKQVEPGDTAFAENEDFSEAGGYTATVPKAAGTYKVHATYAENYNYGPGVANAIMTINPFELQLNMNGSVKPKIYDGTTTAEIDVSKVAFKNKPAAAKSDNVSVKASAFTANFPSPNANEHDRPNVTVKVNDANGLEGADAANYTLAVAQHKPTGRIYQRPIKLVLKQTIEKHYGETYTFTPEDYQAAPAEQQPANGGLVDGETMDMLRATVTAKKNGVDGASAAAEVDEYPVTASTINAGGYNYRITPDSLGTLKVVQTTPKELSVNSDNGVVGQTLQGLVDEHFTGTFENPYSHETVEGTLAWKTPGEKLTKEKSEYDYVFTPTDRKNYTTVDGKIKITVSDKPVARISEWNVPENPVYNGFAHRATLVPEDNSAQTKVEYKRNSDVSPHGADSHNAELSSVDVWENWTEAPPIDAGTYSVRGTIYEYGNYAENTVSGTMTILQAEPTGEVAASNVNKGAYLSDSVLTHTFKGIDNVPLKGSILWEKQGGISAGDVPVDPDEEYEWRFIPDDQNYKTVTGTTKVALNIDTRAAQTEIYNLPANYDQIGDYAYVNVDDVNVKAGDTITFYKDAQMTNPENMPFVITEEMHGWTMLNLDDNALNTEKGTLYVNIKGSETVTPVNYNAEVGFRVSPTQLYLKPSVSGTLMINPSDASYSVASSTWTAEKDGVVTIAPAQDNLSATVTGAKDGNTRITVTVEFTHPDKRMEDKTVTITNYASVTVTEDEPPTYAYTTKEATDVTATGATLNGHIDITVPEGSSVRPSAVGMFLLWEKDGQTEDYAVRYGADNPIVLNQSGDYSIMVNDLKPDTTYIYRAVGIEGQTVTPGETVTFTTGEGEVILPYVVTNFNVDNSGVASATFTNNGSESIDVSLISASYGTLESLVSAQLTTQSVGAGETVTLTTEALTDIAAKIKAYLWNANTYQPYADAVVPEQ